MPEIFVLFCDECFVCGTESTEGAFVCSGDGITLDIVFELLKEFCKARRHKIHDFEAMADPTAEQWECYCKSHDVFARGFFGRIGTNDPRIGLANNKLVTIRYVAGASGDMVDATIEKEDGCTEDVY